MPRPGPHSLAQTAPDEATPVSAVAAALVPFPEDVAARYLANGSWSRHSLAESFRRAAQAWPGRTALICDGTEWTYAELDARADRRAAGFNALGLAPGSAVLLQVNNTAEAVVTWYALLKAGLVPVCTGKKVPLSHFAALRDRGIWSGQLFGMGEGLCLVTPLDAPEIARMTTVGTPLANEDEVRILEPGGEAQLGTDVIGELCARGPYTLRGYFNAPEHNVRAFTSDGFYRTGDLAAARVIDGVTYYTMEGRIKDMINRGGEKISAAEVELLLVSHPGVSEAALVAMPDQRLGERACAFLVPTGVEVSLQDIRAHLESLGVAKYKWPERLVWLDSLPRRSAVGKIDKETLRNRAQTLSLEPR